MHRKLLIGANEGWYTKVHEAVPAVSCRRVYFSEHNYVPGEWPSTKNASTTLVSIRPVPADLLAGPVDTRIKAFLRTAPSGSDLTAWHEAGNLPGYPSYITAPGHARGARPHAPAVPSHERPLRTHCACTR